MTAKKPVAPNPVAKSAAKAPAAAVVDTKPKAKTAAPAPAATAKTAAVKAAPGKSAAKSAPVKPGAKPVAKAGKKGAITDKKNVPLADVEDLPDVEFDAEAEVEVEVEVVDEKETKAKPLRMKVSRAKERALMREFGLDETLLTEEEVAKRRHELKTLIKMGKTRGFLKIGRAHV